MVGKGLTHAQKNHALHPEVGELLYDSKQQQESLTWWERSSTPPLRRSHSDATEELFVLPAGSLNTHDALVLNVGTSALTT
jgi:hypothetical protein